MEICITNNETEQFKKIISLETKKNEQDLKSSIFNINNSYGKGAINSYYFDGLLINIIRVKFKENMQFTGIHNFNTLEFSILLQGQKLIQIPDLNKNFIQEQNESYLVHANTVKGKLLFYKDKPIKEIKIRMYDSFINKHKLHTLLSQHQINAKQLLNNNFSMQLTSKMEEIALEILSNKQEGFFKRIFLESKTLELLNQHLAFKHKESDNILKKIYKAEAYIQSNINKQITISALARFVLLNEKILKAEFKKIFGTSIFSYSQELRMTKAKLLLHNTEKPIYEIADSVGYKNPTHFTAAFKKLFLITPKQFRGKVAI